MLAIVQRLIAVAVLLLFVTAFAEAQDASSTEPDAVGQTAQKQEVPEKDGMTKLSKLDLSPPPAPQRNVRSAALSDFLSDQKDLWTSPARLRFSDSEWL